MKTYRCKLCGAVVEREQDLYGNPHYDPLHRHLATHEREYELLTSFNVDGICGVDVAFEGIERMANYGKLR